jgi:hypothetical protein
VKEDEAKKKEAETKKEDWSVLRSSRFSFYGWCFFPRVFHFSLTSFGGVSCVQVDGHLV